MEVLLDSSFILACLEKRIDFLEQLKLLGFKIVVPKEVFEELKDLKEKGRVSREKKSLVSIALDMLEDNKSVKKKKLGEKTVDLGLIKQGREGIFIASLDSSVKKEARNRVVIADSKKSVLVERD